MASRAGDGEEALQFIERLEQELPEEAAQIWSPEILIVLKSNVAIALERYEESLQELSKQRSLSVSLNGEANFAQDEMLALTRLGRHDEAKSRGRAAIDALPGRSEAERIRIGLSVADLARELEDSELERSALDRAAEAAIHRIQQVHACSKSLPELYDRAEPELSEFRVRFADDHRRFRERITTLLTRHPDLQVDLFPDGQLTCVCAWCQNTRIGESWVPIGHLLTSRPGLRITHGICPNCAVSVDAETEMRLPVNPKSH